MKRYILIPFLIVMSPSLHASLSENSHDDLEELRSALTDIDLSKFTLHDGNDTPPSPPPSHGRLHRELSQKTIEDLDTVQTAAGQEIPITLSLIKIIKEQLNHWMFAPLARLKAVSM